MRDRAEFMAARNYIHQNPVEKRYCETPQQYRWSSAWEGYAGKADA
jgi:hypothetical protein